jgi:hypothetical protein
MTNADGVHDRMANEDPANPVLTTARKPVPRILLPLNSISAKRMRRPSLTFEKARNKNSLATNECSVVEHLLAAQRRA